MSEQRPKRTGKPLRRQRVERREAAARLRGWCGAWPPDKPRIGSAADCEHYLGRLEAGEQRAGFLAALGDNLVAYFEALTPEHFERFAAALLAVAENPRASHRSRLRAVQAAIRPLRRAVTILPRLQRAGEHSLQARLESLLGAFCRRLSAERFGRLARVLAHLAGPAARTDSDRVRACEAALLSVTDGLAMLGELRTLKARRPQGPDADTPDAQARAAEIDAKIAALEAEVAAEAAAGR